MYQEGKNIRNINTEEKMGKRSNIENEIVKGKERREPRREKTRDEGKERMRARRKEGGRDGRKEEGRE